MVYFQFPNGFVIPALKVSFNSTGKYGVDARFATLDSIEASLRHPARAFQSNETFEATWHELAAIRGIPQSNLFYLLARLEAEGRLTGSLRYVCDPNPGQHGARVAVPVYDHERTGPPEFLAGLLDLLAGASASERARAEALAAGPGGPSGLALLTQAQDRLDISSIGTPDQPKEDGIYFKLFLAFLAVSYHGASHYVGSGRFLVRSEPYQSLIAETGTRNSLVADIVAALETAATNPGSAPAVAPLIALSGGAAVGVGVEEIGEIMRDAIRQTAGHLEQLNALANAGLACSVGAPEAEFDFGGGANADRLAYCEQCVKESDAYISFADDLRWKIAASEAAQLVGSAAGGCVAGAVLVGIFTAWCGGCGGVAVGTACGLGAAAGFATSLGYGIEDAFENEAYIHQYYQEAVKGCMENG